MRITTDLKDKRALIKISQRALGERAGIKYAYISEFETGKRMPTPEQKKALATAIGKPLVWEYTFKEVVTP
jgi:transcriptional regulator with XRE-family HTH domain